MLNIGTPGYTHTQETPSAVWTVVHNLKRTVITDVFIHHKGVLEKIMASTKIVDNNTLTVTFSEPRTGVVRVI